MYEKIVVSLSLDHGFGSRAIDIARRLKSEGGEIIAVHVFEPVNNSVGLFVPPEHLAKVRKNAEDEIAERIGEEKDVKIVMLEGHSGRAITEYAEQIGADCIFVGSHKPGLTDYFLGSTAARIVRHAPCSVHVLR
jgi:nucleotide-binding universal stress UspA family protein